MKLTLIRHAESIYNEKRLLQGQVDCELSKKGLKDTEEKSKNFPADFDISFCSPSAPTTCFYFQSISGNYFQNNFYFKHLLFY